MSFKYRATTYKISFSFFALVLLFVTLINDEYPMLVFAFAFLHEIVHLFFIYLISGAPEKVSFTIFGAEIVRGSGVKVNYFYEMLINLSAPLFNLIVGAVCFLFNSESQLIIKAAYVNATMGFFNFLPFYNFDGGNFLRCFFLMYISEDSTEKILTVISIAVAVVFSFITVFVFINCNHNFSMIIITVYMFFSIAFKK